MICSVINRIDFMSDNRLQAMGRSILGREELVPRRRLRLHRLCVQTAVAFLVGFGVLLHGVANEFYLGALELERSVVDVFRALLQIGKVGYEPDLRYAAEHAVQALVGEVFLGNVGEEDGP